MTCRPRPDGVHAAAAPVVTVEVVPARAGRLRICDTGCPSHLGTVAGGYSSHQRVTSDTWPVPVFQIANGSAVAAGGTISSSPLSHVQIRVPAPGTNSRPLYAVGAVGCVPYVVYTACTTDAASMM